MCLLLLSPVIMALIVGNLVFLRIGMSMEQSPPFRQTDACTLNTYTFSLVIGFTLNLHIEKNNDTGKIYFAKYHLFNECSYCNY